MVRLGLLAPYFFVIFVTGVCSLVYQVVWQRYLSILVGNEAKSSTLIVGVFLAGLALGYYIWGKLTLSIPERRRLLKIYGVIELVTGIYAMLFPTLFSWVLPLSQALPHWFVSDLFVCIVLILPPTFLMGATGAHDDLLPAQLLRGN